jgi:hypothetical protein
MRFEEHIARVFACVIVCSSLLSACAGGNDGTPTAFASSHATAPLVPTLQFAGTEDTALQGTLNRLGRTGSDLQFGIVSAPRHGKISVDSVTGEFAYLPDANYAGTDSFSYRTRFPSGRTQVEIATIALAGVNDPPTFPAMPDMMNSAETHDSVVNLPAFDVDGDPLHVVVTSDDPNIATIAASSGDRSVTISPGTRGTTKIHVTVSDAEYAADRDFDFTVGDVTKYRTIAANMATGEAITFTNTIDEPVTLTFEHNGFPLFQSDAEIARYVMDLPAQYAGEPFERKLWRFLRDSTYHNVPLTTDPWLHDPWATINSQGWGFCSHVSASFVRIARAAGYDARIWGLTGHVVPEIKIADRWQMYDPDLAVFYYDRESRVAGVEQLASDPALITAPLNAVFAASDYAFPYSSDVAALYGSGYNNFTGDQSFIAQTSARYQLVVLPPGATFTYPGRWTSTVTGVDGTTPYDVPYYLQGSMALPAGSAGNVVMPWMIWEIRGIGRVRVLGTEYDIGSSELAIQLQKPGRQITDIELLSSATEIQFIFFINAMRYGLDATNSVQIRGKDVWAVAVGTRVLEPKSRADIAGASLYRKPFF